MNRSLLLLFAMAGSLTGAELEMLPASPVAAFGGGTRTLQVAFRNRVDHPAEAEIGWGVYQASSATVLPVNRMPLWKKLQLLARQTVLEDVKVELPLVRAETRFLVRFTQGDAMVGLQEVWVYPSNLLAELSSMLGSEPVALQGMPESLPQTLTRAGVKAVELTTLSASKTNRLVLLGPLAGTLGDATPRHDGIIQFLRLPAPDSFIAPLYEVVFTNRTMRVVAQESALTNLSVDPWAQLRLLRMACLATSHERSDRTKTKTLNAP